jgi:hypothetical protein
VLSYDAHWGDVVALAHCEDLAAISGIAGATASLAAVGGSTSTFIADRKFGTYAFSTTSSVVKLIASAGDIGSAAYRWSGYIANVKINKGVARYTKDFTVSPEQNVTIGAAA